MATPVKSRKTLDYITFTGFYPSTFVYSHFPSRIQFLYCLLSSVAQWGGPMVDNQQEIFEIYMCRSLENAFFLNFSWSFRILWGILKKSWQKGYIQLSFMCVCKYLNQRVRIVGEIENLSRVFQKQKRKKKHMKGLSLRTQFKIEFLLLFTGCRKVLGKMAASNGVLVLSGCIFKKRIREIPWLNNEKDAPMRDLLLLAEPQKEGLLLVGSNYKTNTEQRCKCWSLGWRFSFILNVIEKSIKLSNTGFSMKCFTADISHFYSTTVKICLLGGQLSTSPSNPRISGVSLKFLINNLVLFHQWGTKILLTSENDLHKCCSSSIEQFFHFTKLYLMLKCKIALLEIYQI